MSEAAHPPVSESLALEATPTKAPTLRERGAEAQRGLEQNKIINQALEHFDDVSGSVNKFRASDQQYAEGMRQGVGSFRMAVDNSDGRGGNRRAAEAADTLAAQISGRMHQIEAAGSNLLGLSGARADEQRVGIQQILQKIAASSDPAEKAALAAQAGELFHRYNGAITNNRTEQYTARRGVSGMIQNAEIARGSESDRQRHRLADGEGALSQHITAQDRAVIEQNAQSEQRFNLIVRQLVEKGVDVDQAITQAAQTVVSEQSTPNAELSMSDGQSGEVTKAADRAAGRTASAEASTPVAPPGEVAKGPEAEPSEDPALVVYSAAAGSSPAAPKESAPPVAPVSEPAKPASPEPAPAAVSTGATPEVKPVSPAEVIDPPDPLQAEIDALSKDPKIKARMQGPLAAIQANPDLSDAERAAAMRDLVAENRGYQKREEESNLPFTERAARMGEDEEFGKEFNERLEELRKKGGLSAEDLAAEEEKLLAEYQKRKEAKPAASENEQAETTLKGLLAQIEATDPNSNEAKALKGMLASLDQMRQQKTQGRGSSRESIEFKGEDPNYLKLLVGVILNTMIAIAMTVLSGTPQSQGQRR